MMNKKKGSALALALIVLAVLMVFISTLFVVGLTNNKIINANDNSNKLNLMAESGIDAAMAQVKKATSSSSLVNITGLKSTDGTINCEVKFYLGQTYNTTTKSYAAASGKDTIESTASNSKGSKIIRVVLNESIQTVAGIIPTNNLIYLTGSGQTGIGQCSINGDVFINGPLSLSQGSSINGKAIVNGNTTISGAGNTTNGLISFGDVTISNGGQVNGDVRCSGSIFMSGDSKIDGNAYSDGSLTVPSGSPSISSNAIVGSNVSLAGNPRIYGSLSYLTASQNLNTLKSYVSGSITQLSSYTPQDLSSYRYSAPPVISVPSSAQNPQLYIPLPNLSDSNTTINKSGSLSSSILDNLSYGSTITFDTSKSDISLLIDGFDFNNLKKSKGLTFEVLGPNNLYIYLKNTSSFNLQSNEFFGMKDRNAVPKIYIIGDDKQSVSLTNNSELDAIIYIPKGFFKAIGSNYPTFKFVGSSIVNSVSISNDVNLKYPTGIDISGTPLDILNNGGAGQGSTTSFSVDKWYY